MKTKTIIEHLEANLPQSTDAIKQALLDVLLNGKTWRASAISNGVTESGILKAMQRSGVREFVASSGKPH